MRSWLSPWRVFLFVGGLLILGFASAPPCRADAIDDAARLAPEDAVLELEDLLEAAVRDKDEDAELRANVWLARLRLQAGEAYAALQHLESLARKRGQPEDHVSYGETLLAVARDNLNSRTTAAGVVPYLQDALATLAKAEVRSREGHGALPAGLAVRLALARGEALYILHRHDEAAAELQKIDVAGQPLAVAQRLLDLLARTHYAAGRFEDAATAFLALGNDLGAAAAYDAARKPEQSVPLYVRVLKTQPGDEALLGRAVQGARFSGGEALLLEALADLALPEGEAGVPLLLTRADLLEATNRTAEALAPLREAASRAPTDARAPARLGRLVLLTGDVESDDTWDAAAAAYQEALVRDPESEAASAGLYYIAGRDYSLLWKRWRDPRLRDRCLGVQRALVRAQPDDALALSNLGNTLRVLGQTDEALALYARAREANPYDPSVRSDQGLALSAAGRMDEALQAYLDSIELDAGHRAGRQNAARALWLAGRDTQAAEQLQDAIPSAHAVGRSAGTYVFLMGRTWRTTRDPGLR